MLLDFMHNVVDSDMNWVRGYCQHILFVYIHITAVDIRRVTDHHTQICGSFTTLLKQGCSSMVLTRKDLEWSSFTHRWKVAASKHKHGRKTRSKSAWGNQSKVASPIPFGPKVFDVGVCEFQKNEVGIKTQRWRFFNRFRKFPWTVWAAWEGSVQWMQ